MTPEDLDTRDTHADDLPPGEGSRMPLLVYLVFFALVISLAILGVAFASVGGGLLLDRVFGMGATNGAWIVLGAAVVVALFLGIVADSVMLNRIREEYRFGPTRTLKTIFRKSS